MTDTSRTFNILMLEHDADDRFITSSVLETFKHRVNIHFVSNPEDFLDYLNRDGNSVPDLIILDIMTPSGSGLQLLKDTKQDSRFGMIPLIVVSGTAYPQLVNECYSAGANTFFTKPVSDKETFDKITFVIEYWFKMAELPNCFTPIF